ncbi:MAG: hypothetical protein MJ230_02720 [bacterium]|nr:hypothetical protein [bacterium]
MKRIIALFVILCLALPSNAAFWNRKDKNLEAEMQGKGYAGTLPDLESKFQKNEKKLNVFYLIFLKFLPRIILMLVL